MSVTIVGVSYEDSHSSHNIASKGPTVKALIIAMVQGHGVTDTGSHGQEMAQSYTSCDVSSTTPPDAWET